MLLALRKNSFTEIYVYDFPDSPRMGKIRSYLSKLSEIRVVFCYLNNSEYLEELMGIVKILIQYQVPILPPNVCTPCMLQREDWQEMAL